MAGFIDRLLGRKTSANSAKERLQLVLIHDRSNLPPGVLEALRDEIIEVISPGEFEDYFREVAAAWGDMEKFAAINAKYALEMDFGSVPDLCGRFGLTFPSL